MSLPASTLRPIIRIHHQKAQVLLTNTQQAHCRVWPVLVGAGVDCPMRGAMFVIKRETRRFGFKAS